jgi:hypothetical protein
MIKALALIIGGLMAVGILVVALKTVTGEDTWICSGGKWVQHGKPFLPQPTFPCPTVEPTPTIIDKE